MDLETFKSIVGNRKIYIFSLNLEAIGIARNLRKKGFEIGAFVDTRKFKNNSKEGIPIIHPDDFFQKNDKNNSFVVISSKHRKMRRTFMKLLESYGFIKKKDYIRILEDLYKYIPTIEIVGNCNLRCISCECGHKDVKNTGFMSIEMYKKILSKMTKEIPFLSSIYLYLWGEPLLHPDIDKFITTTKEFGLSVEVSTNLNFAKNLEKFVASNPDQIIIPCSGVGKNYEITHTGGKWEVFKENLFLLKEYIDKYNVDTIVRFIFHLYRHNEEDYWYLKELVRDLGFQFYPILGNAFPGKVYDYVILGKELPQELKELDKYLIFPIEEQLEFAYEHRHLKCTNWLVFPTIRSDGSVLTCCNMMHYQLYPNYLDISFEELDKLRENNEVCRKCLEHGIHRFFDVHCEIKESNNKLEVRRLL